MRTAFEVLALGWVGVDLYPPEIGIPLSQVKSFDKFLGGSPTNVAVAAARFGHSSAVITRVGDDGFGEYVRVALRGFGVDDRYVGTDPVLRTPLVFPEIYPPDHFPLLFYREPKALLQGAESAGPEHRGRRSRSRCHSARRDLLDYRYWTIRRAEPVCHVCGFGRARTQGAHHP